MTGEIEQLPAKIGPFLVTRVLGRGGMGIVYAGKHEDTGVEAAIKTVAEGRARLMAYVRHEASTLARIRHPGVVHILGHGIEAGRPWYAMELLTGRTLSVLLEGSARTDSFDGVAAPRGSGRPGAVLDDLATRPARSSLATEATIDAPLIGGAIGSESGVLRPTLAHDFAELLPILRGVCTALAFVHGEGVVHRDLKPDNIFIRTGDLPVLVDFGLATQVGADSRDVLQNVGGVAGSFSYMAPEQLRGELLDARCDLYALGCILYRVLTGRLPFEGTPAQVTAGHLMDPALPPSLIVPSLPSVLDDLIAGLLAKDRDHRISSVEVVDAVLASIGGAPCHWPVPVPAPQPFLYRPPFVGRQDLLGPLGDRLQQFLKAPARPAGLVLIAGESGAGKTRLAIEAIKLGAESNATTIACACAPGAGPFQPLQELFLALVEHCVVEGERETARVFGDGAAVLALYSTAIAALPGVAALPEPEALPSAAARARVFRCLAETLRAYGRDRSLLLLLDDVHLADSLTLDFLAYLQGAELADPPRVLVLGTYRSEERTPALDALAQLPATLHLTVDRMTEAEVGQMVRGMLALDDPPPAFVAFLSRESGGNPFFVAEYLRTAVAERVVVRDRRGHWQIAHSLVPTEEICEQLPLPRSLRQLVELRLGKLAAPTREVLDATAVIGRRFSRALIREVIEIDDDALAAALDEMVGAQVVEPIEIEDGGYRFVHDKLHELPAAALEPARRRALHARIADAMQRVHADALAEHEATIGRHWAAAGEPARAHPLLHAAGDRARRFHSVATAIELYRAARGEVEQLLGDADPATRDQARDISEKLGDALAFNGQHAPARAAFQQVLDALEAEADAPVVARARLMRKIAKTWEITHAYPDALAGYAAIEALIDASPEHAAELEPEWIQLMVGRAWICYWSNRVDDMNAVIEPLRPVIEARGSALDRYRFYLALVTRDYRRDRYRIAPETLDHMRDCVAAAREAHALSEIAFARFVRGFGLLFARKLEDAEAELDTALQAARKISDAVAETRASAYLAVAHSLLGRFEAEATATATLTMARARKMADYEGVALALLGRQALLRGDRDQARALCEQAIAVWNAMTYPFPFRWIAALPLIELGLGRVPAPELAKLARELTATAQQHLPDPIDLALKAAAEATELGDNDAVEDPLFQVVDHAHQLGYMNHDYEPRRWRHGNSRLADRAGADREGPAGPGDRPRRV